MIATQPTQSTYTAPNSTGTGSTGTGTPTKTNAPTGTISTYGGAGGGGNTNASGTSSSVGASLNQSSFLNLLSVQLQNQDPLNPISDEAWVSELAQFSSLQETSALNTTLTNSTSFTELTQAAGLVGKNVTTSAVDSSGNAIGGTVSSVSLSSAGVVMNIGTNAVTINQLTGFTS